MQFRASLSGLESIYTGLLLDTSLSVTAATPSLAGYSPVPSMQMVATQHSSAIVGSSGCSVVVSASIDREIEWSSANLRSMITALEAHEADTGSAFTAIDPGNAPDRIQTANGLLHHAFGARPPFNPGMLVFAPAVVGPELAETAESLLSKFIATNDAAVGDAITYWTGYATRMGDLATALGTAASRLLAENEGAAFDAAAASLTGLATRVGNVAASAGILSTHLGALPGVKAMAINALGSIETQGKMIKDPAAREAFERAEISAFMAGPYNGQLQTAVPTLSNLTQPDFRVSAPDLVASGVAGGHGLAGASQVGLSPAGTTGAASAATAPASAAASMAPAASGPITSPNGMSPGGGTPASAGPTAPATSGPISPVPGGSGAPLAPSGATAPSGALGNRGGLPQSPTGMAGTGAGTSGAGAATGGRGTGVGSGVAGLAGGAPGSRGGASAGRAGGSFGTGVGNGATNRGRGIGAHAIGGAPATGAGTAGKSATTVGGTRSTPMSGHAHAATANGRGGAGMHGAAMHRNGSRPDANVNAIRGTGRDFEQDEYQRELFGDEPTTVPAVIGANVRG